MHAGLEHFAGNIQNGTVPCHIVIRIHGDQLHVHALQNNDHLVNNGMVH